MIKYAHELDSKFHSLTKWNGSFSTHRWYFESRLGAGRGFMDDQGNLVAWIVK